MAENIQAPPEHGKKKVSKGNIIILVILLIIFGILALYYLKDESVLGDCEKPDDCGRYNVFYVKGEGYVCANNQLAIDKSIKTKVMMFKYASKNAVDSEPAGCLCVEDQCEVN